MSDGETFLVGVPAMLALGKIGPAALVAFSDMFANVGDPSFSSNDIVDAVSGLGPGVIPKLVSHLEAKRDDSGELAPGPSVVAGAILARFGTVAVPTLIRALARPRSRITAAQALRDIGPPAAPAVPALLQAYRARGTDIWDRLAVVAALAAIGSPACSARPHLEAAVDRFRRQRAPAELSSPSIEEESVVNALKRIPSCDAAKGADLLSRLRVQTDRRRIRAADDDADALALRRLIRA
jgi:hypothetical protein